MDGTKDKAAARKRKASTKTTERKGKRCRTDRPYSTQFLEALLDRRGTLGNELGNNSKVVDQYCKKIKEELEHLDRLVFNSSRIVKTGSTCEGLKVNKPTEFDVMLELQLGLQQCFKIMYPKGDALGYARLKKNKDMTSEKFYCFKKFLEKGADTNEYLSAEALMSHFRAKMTEAINNITLHEKLSTLKIVNSFEQNCPAVTVSIANDRQAPVLVDFVLAIVWKGWPRSIAPPFSWPDKACIKKCRDKFHLVAKCSNDVENSSTFWRISFSTAEKKLLTSRKMGTQTKSLKLVKIIMELKRLFNQSDFKSYHVKTALMNVTSRSCFSNDHWSKDNLGPRVIDLLEEIKNNLKTKQLNHFFVPKLNLLRDYDTESLAHSVAKVVENLEKNPKEFCEKILHTKT